jgi:hypothetical protein
MSLIPRHVLWAFGGCLALAGLSLAPAQGVNWFRPYVEESQPDVFYNYYVPGNGGTPAAMYPAPYPTPRHVGHTYTTYQPWMPHEHLYRHHYTQHQYYDSGMGMNRTKVKWSYPPVRTAIQNTRHWFMIPR